MVHSTSAVTFAALALQVATTAASPFVVTGDLPHGLKPAQDMPFEQWNPNFAGNAAANPPPSTQPPSSSPVSPVRPIGPLRLPFGPGLKLPMVAKRDLDDRDVEGSQAQAFPEMFARRAARDDEVAQLARLLSSRGFVDELDARGLLSKSLPFAVSAIPHMIDLLKNSGSAAQRRSEVDQEWERLLASREFVDELERRGFGSIFNKFPKAFDFLKDILSPQSNAPSAAPPPAPSQPTQKRNNELDIKELERLLSRELTDVERRAIGTQVTTWAPLIPIALQAVDWLKDKIHPAQPSASAAPQ